MRIVLKYILLLVLLLVLQTTVFENFFLFGYLQPFAYILFLINFPFIDRHYYILLGFMIGLCLDVVLNTFGVHAIACLFATYFRSMYLNLFVFRDVDIDIKSINIKTVGFWKYFKYVVFFTTIHHWLLYFLQNMTGYNILEYTLRALENTILSIGIMYILYFVLYKKEK